MYKVEITNNVYRPTVVCDGIERWECTSAATKDSIGNASLFATAPELLAALESLLRYETDIYKGIEAIDECPMNAMNAVSNAYAAIAKAKGE